MHKLSLLVFSVALAFGQAGPEKQSALEVVEAIRPEIRDISMRLWDISEIALQEKRSADLLVGILEKEGFQVESGIAGMPTAFIASHGSGNPVIGVLAEYDALPGVGNSVVPRREARQDGVKTGQGCGHNLFAAGSVGAAIAIKRTMEKHGLPGTVRLYGTPAEETVVGKIYMAKEGVFDDLDGVLEWHPGDETKVRNQPGRALNNFEVEFTGQAAHASADPWNGRSALDAVEMMNYGVNLMREHVMPTARIHYVIPNAGEAPNVVPEYAKVWYFVRDENREAVEKWYAWIKQIAAGAAMATRTEHKTFLITGVHAYNLNRPLQEAMQSNLELIGAPQFTAREQEFAKKLQKYLKIEEKGFVDEVTPLEEKVGAVEGGSTDVADVSHIAPTVGLSVTTAAYEVPWHSWASTACHGTEASVKGAVVAAKVMAATGIDLLTDAGLREKAKAHFLEKTGGKPYRSPVPLDQKVPMPEDK